MSFVGWNERAETVGADADVVENVFDASALLHRQHSDLGVKLFGGSIQIGEVSLQGNQFLSVRPGGQVPQDNLPPFLRNRSTSFVVLRTASSPSAGRCSRKCRRERRYWSWTGGRRLGGQI